jgi:hypothetical protein
LAVSITLRTACETYTDFVRLRLELAAGYARINGPITTTADSSRDPAQQTYHSCSIRMRDGKFHPARVLFDVETHESCDVLVIAPTFGIAIIRTNKERNEYVRIGLVVVRRVNLNETKGVSTSFFR